ncbi:MAG: c-type cytochrome domain-containing protein [Zavarzinella sp.]
MHYTFKFSFIAVLALLSHGGQLFSQQVSFIKEVAPIFKEYCFACHDSKKRSGKYDMTTFEQLLEGGAGGEGIVPGKLKESDLFHLIVTDEKRRMPPRKDNLSGVPAAKAAIIKTWIEQGAKLDGGIEPKANLVKELRIRWQPPTPPEKYQFPAVINALVFTTDDKQLIVSGHHELTFWDVATGKLAKRLRTRAERAYAIIPLDDNRIIVAGARPGQEGDICIYNISAAGPTANGVVVLDGVANPKVREKTLLEVEDSVLALDLSPDGKQLAAGGCDRIIRVWDLASGKIVREFENHADWVMGVRFTPDGTRLLSCSRDKTAKIWDLKTNESIMTMPDHQNIVYGVGVKADGKTGYSVGADKQVRSWLLSGQGKGSKGLGSHGDEILHFKQHPKLPLGATASADKTVKLWDLEKGTNTKTFTGLKDHVFAVAISTKGELVAAGGYDGEVKIWQVADGKETLSFIAAPGYVKKADPK